jgi:MOSC domain-containing protein YiiM
VQRGDKIEVVKRDENNVKVTDIVSLYINRDNADSIETMRRATKISVLPEGWKNEFQQNIEQLELKS